MESRLLMVLLLPILIWITPVAEVHAATFYIDYATGNDSNGGTTRTSPWKHCPAMQPFSGSYTHAAGDLFIFKGGVTWPNAALPLYITVGGTSETPDIYGVDFTWFTGPSWSRPVFDGEGIAFTNHAGNRGNVIWIKGSKSANITIDNIEIKNFVYNNPITTNTSDCNSVYIDSSANVWLKNLFIHDWVVKVAGDTKFGGPNNYNSSVTRATACTIRGPSYIDPEYVSKSGWNASGVGVMQFHLIEYCDISRTTQGLWNPRVAHDNVIHDGGESYDTATHENGAWLQGNAQFYNNRMANLAGGVGVYFLPGWGGATNAVMRVYNNIFHNIPQLGLQPTGSVDSTNELWFVNNIVARNSVTGIDLGTTKAGEPFSKLVVQNNVFITTSSSLGQAINVIDPGDLGPDYRNSNNVLYSPGKAADLGMISSEYKPKVVVPALVDTGTDVDLWPFMTTDREGKVRVRGKWDIGPYEHVEEPTLRPAAPLGVRLSSGQ